MLPPAVQVFERGWLSSNNILLTSRLDATLVDTGYVTHAAQTLSLVRHALQGRPLDRIVNTHLHADHCGGNAALRAAYGCRIAIPAAECAKVDAWDEDALSFRATAQQCPRFTYDDALEPGRHLRMGPGLAGAGRARPRSACAAAVVRGGGHPDLGRCAVAERLRRRVPGTGRRTRFS